MNISALKISAATLMPAIVTMLFVQACGSSGDAVAQAAADPLEGMWDTVGTLRDCTTSVATATFRASQAVHRGGTLTGINSGNPGGQSPSVGLWSKNADGSYAIKFRFYRFNADGSPAGSNVITSTRTLAVDGNTFTATTRNEVRDATGAVLQTLCVTDTGARFS